MELYLPTQFRNKQKQSSFPTYLFNIMVSTTQTLAQIKPRDFIDHIKQHFMTSPLTYVTNGIQEFIKMLYQKMGAPRPSTRQRAIFGRLRPVVPIHAVSCFNPEHDMRLNKHRGVIPSETINNKTITCRSIDG